MAKRAKKTGSLIDTGKYEYKRVSIRGKDGKIHHSAINGDAVSKAMLLHLVGNGGTVASVIRDNGLGSKFKDLNGNAGTLRMSLGVVLRGMVRNDQPVKIGSITIKSLKQAIELPKVEKLERKASKPRKAAKKAKAASKPRAKRAPRTPSDSVASEGAEAQ